AGGVLPSRSGSHVTPTPERSPRCTSRERCGSYGVPSASAWRKRAGSWSRRTPHPLLDGATGPALARSIGPGLPETVNAPGSVESARLTSCHFGRVDVHPLELDRGEHPGRALPTLAVVDDLQVLEDRVRARHESSTSGGSTARPASCPRTIQPRRYRSDPRIEPIDGTRPESRARRVN